MIRDLPKFIRTWRASESLETFLDRGKIVAIADIDTRKLTRILREKGAQAGCIMTGDKVDAQAAVRLAKKFPGLKGMDLAKVVTTKRIYQWNEGTNWAIEPAQHPRPITRLHVVAYDFGIKRNILRLLSDSGCRVTVVPAQTSSDKVLAMLPDGVFLSNGPAIRSIAPTPWKRSKNSRNRCTVFGICLGHQLLGLASGAKTMK